MFFPVLAANFNIKFNFPLRLGLTDYVNSTPMLEEKDLNSDILISSIDKCLDENFSKNMKENMDKLAIKDSSLRIYNTLKDMIGK